MLLKIEDKEYFAEKVGKNDDRTRDDRSERASKNRTEECRL